MLGIWGARRIATVATYLIALWALASRCGLLMEDVAVRCDGGVLAVASPVRTRLRVNRLVTVVLAVVGGVAVHLPRVGGVLRRALLGLHRGVYGYIRVRLQLLSIILGLRMGSNGLILKI